MVCIKNEYQKLNVLGLTSRAEDVREAEVGQLLRLHNLGHCGQQRFCCHGPTGLTEGPAKQPRRGMARKPSQRAERREACPADLGAY